MLGCLCAVPARADVQRDTYGGVGVVETPSARMAPDGSISLGASFFENTQRYNLGFQIFPWLEGSFRYSGLQHFNPAFPVYYDRSFAVKARLWDEGAYMPAIAVGVNDLVGTGVYGGEYIVASKQFGAFDASLGMGWGRLGSSGGFRNPLGALSKSIYKREDFSGQGGNFNLGQYFHGSTAAVFGGLTWRTPLTGLTLAAEYSSDAYQAERLAGNFTPRNQLNIGASYQITDSTQLGLGWLYGQSLSGTLTFELDPVHPQYPAALAPEMPPATVRSQPEQQAALQILVQRRSPALNASRAGAARMAGLVDALFQGGVGDVRVEGRRLFLVPPPGQVAGSCQRYVELVRRFDTDINDIVLGGTHCALQNTRAPTPALPVQAAFGTFTGPILIDAAVGAVATPADIRQATAKIRKDVASQRLIVEGINLGDSEAAVYFSNTVYSSQAEAVERVSRALMNDAPASVEKFRLIAIEQSVPNREFNVLRAPAERALAQDSSLEFASQAVTSQPAAMSNPILTGADRRSFPRFSWSLTPQFRQAFFDPSSPFGVQFLALLSGQVEVWRGLTFGGAAEGTLYDNFDTSRIGNSVLPHVRSDFNQYFTHGKNGLANLELDYRFRITPEVYAIARAGYLESMFAGAGGEVLWRPEGDRWALGIDAYHMWQRGYDRLLDLQRYKAFTGHVSLYYQSPWYDLNFAVRAGQYLAGDRGLTLEVTRRFATGVEIGAFVTKTNVSSAQFGEGSFDKGIIIRIPLDWALPIKTQSELNVDLRPIQRDGGQRLLGDTLLYGDTRRSSIGEMLNRERLQ